MARLTNQERVDELIKYFWKNGFLTISRKFGTHLPDPKPVGKYEIDAIGKYKKKYAIGITFKEDDLNDPKIFNKISFLASRHSKSSNRYVTLFVGVHQKYIDKARLIVSNLEESVRKNIKLVAISKVI